MILVLLQSILLLAFLSSSVVVTAATPVLSGTNNSSSNTILFLKCDQLSIENPNDVDLFRLGINRTLGNCWIEVSVSYECEFYVIGKQPNNNDGGDSYTGIPNGGGSGGDGCVFQSQNNNNDGVGGIQMDGNTEAYETSTSCLYNDFEMYPSLTSKERESMCSSRVVQNAAAQLRYGILNGYCGCDIGEEEATPNPTTTAPTTSSPTVAPTTSAVPTMTPPPPPQYEINTNVTWIDEGDVDLSAIGRINWATFSQDGLRLLVFRRALSPEIFDLVLDTTQEGEEEPLVEERWELVKSSSEFSFRSAGFGGGPSGGSSAIVINANGRYIVGPYLDSITQQQTLHVYDLDTTGSSSATPVYEFPFEWTYQDPGSPQFGWNGFGLIKETTGQASNEYKVMSYDGTIMAIQVERSYWDEPTQQWISLTETEGGTGIRIMTSSVTGWWEQQIGQTLTGFAPPNFGFNVEEQALQINKAGTSIYVATTAFHHNNILQAGPQLVEYRYNSLTNIWEIREDHPIPLGYISPNGNRVAVLRGKDDIVIYQRELGTYSSTNDDNTTTTGTASSSSSGSGDGGGGAWKEIAVIRVDRSSTGYGYDESTTIRRDGFDTFQWGNDDGTYFVVGDTSEEFVLQEQSQQGGGEVTTTTGAIYAFEQKECNTTTTTQQEQEQQQGGSVDSTISTHYYCSFQLLGEVIRTDLVRYSRLHVSRSSGGDNGDQIFYLKNGISRRTVGSFKIITEREQEQAGDDVNVGGVGEDEEVEGLIMDEGMITDAARQGGGGEEGGGDSRLRH